MKILAICLAYNYHKRLALSLESLTLAFQASNIDANIIVGSTQDSILSLCKMDVDNTMHGTPINFLHLPEDRKLDKPFLYRQCIKNIDILSYTNILTFDADIIFPVSTFDCWSEFYPRTIKVPSLYFKPRINLNSSISDAIVNEGINGSIYTHFRLDDQQPLHTRLLDKEYFINVECTTNPYGYFFLEDDVNSFIDITNTLSQKHYKGVSAYDMTYVRLHRAKGNNVTRLPGYVYHIYHGVWGENWKGTNKQL